MTAPTKRLCPTCHEPVIQPALGRPRIYCSADCRRDMYSMVGDLRSLDWQVAEAEKLAASAHSEMWRQHHERSRAALRLAVDELRSRIPEDMR